MKRIATICAIMCACSMLCAKGTAQSIKKNYIFVFKPPVAVLRADVKYPSFRLPYTVYTATIEADGDAVKINGDAEWHTAGFPSLIELRVDKIRQDKKSGNTVIELKNNDDTRFDLTFRGDREKLFAAITGPVGGSASYLRDTFEALASKLFVGPLASIPHDKKIELLTYAHTVAHGAAVSSQVYKDSSYLVIDLGRDKSVYNDLKLNEPQRTAMVIREKLLALLKAFAGPVQGVTAINGVKLKMLVPHKSFLDRDADPMLDRLELFAPSTLVKKFADADITSQQLIDGCFVIVNDNRVQVVLAGP